jgi:hypothetical protein
VFVEGVFERAGLTPLILTRTEVSLAKKTPDIKWAMFIKLFGGTVTDWPQCPKVPGYEDFLCTSIIAQPFMPLVPGEPGLVLRLPAVIASETPQSDRDKSTFHVLSAARSNGALHYKGKYRKIPLPQIQFTSTNFPHKKVRLWTMNMLKPLHIMDAFLTLFSLGKGGSSGSQSRPPCVPIVHA